MIVGRAAGQRATFAGYFLLFLLPIAAGTGLLSAARAGEMDLLFGAGETRSHLWWQAFALSFVLPGIVATAIFVAGGFELTLASAARLGTVVCFTGGVGFAAGLVEMRYTAGIVWLLTRLLIVMVPSGLSAVAALERGQQLPGPFVTSLIVVAAPEIAIGPSVPAMYSGACLLAGAAVIAWSYHHFTHADLVGKRSQ